MVSAAVTGGPKIRCWTAVPPRWVASADLASAVTMLIAAAGPDWLTSSPRPVTCAWFTVSCRIDDWAAE